jgi:hypothetical protein
MPDITHQLALWADALRAIAQTGLAFQPRSYDQERYEALLELAGQMTATLNTPGRPRPPARGRLRGLLAVAYTGRRPGVHHPQSGRRGGGIQ